MSPSVAPSQRSIARWQSRAHSLQGVLDVGFLSPAAILLWWLGKGDAVMGFTGWSRPDFQPCMPETGFCVMGSLPLKGKSLVFLYSFPEQEKHDWISRVSLSPRKPESQRLSLAKQMQCLEARLQGVELCVSWVPCLCVNSHSSSWVPRVMHISDIILHAPSLYHLSFAELLSGSFCRINAFYS